MPLVPGKYDDACTNARRETEAVGVILIVVAGKHGHGFSVQTADPDLEKQLPTLLRYTANLIEIENKKGLSS